MRTDYVLLLRRILLLPLFFMPVMVLAQEHPIKLAAEALFSVKADAAVKELTDGRGENSSTHVSRMNWVPESEQPQAYVATRPITHLGWKEIAIAFTPRHAGMVTLELYGPWERAPGADIYRQEVWWDDVRVTGAELKNGGFELALDAPGSSWKSTGAVRVAATNEMAAAEGNYLAKTWHNERMVCALAVTGGKTVTVSAKVRSVKPASFKEMKQITAHDTPAHQATKRLRRGVNFGNYLEVPPGQNWAVNHTGEDFAQIQRAGFDHVRLPVGWHHYAGTGPEFKLSDEIFAKVDQHVAQARQHQLSIIINIHHFDDFTTDPVKHRDKFVAIWKQIAEHYAQSPDAVFFELLNEPKDALTTAVLNPIFGDVIRQIRRSNPRRTLLVGPGKWNSVSELVNLQLPDDDQNLIVTVHNYDPFRFTHQGAAWAGPDLAVKGIRFPGPPTKPLVPDPSLAVSADVRDWITRYNSSPGATNPCSAAALKAVADQAKEWSEYYGRPMHFGEFGAFLEIDAESRANYVRAFRTAFDEADLGWALWDWKAQFRYWDADHNRPVPGFQEALFPKR